MKKARTEFGAGFLFPLISNCLELFSARADADLPLRTTYTIHANEHGSRQLSVAHDLCTLNNDLAPRTLPHIVIVRNAGAQRWTNAAYKRLHGGVKLAALGAEGDARPR